MLILHSSPPTPATYSSLKRRAVFSLVTSFNLGQPVPSTTQPAHPFFAQSSPLCLFRHFLSRSSATPLTGLFFFFCIWYSFRCGCPRGICPWLLPFLFSMPLPGSPISGLQRYFQHKPLLNLCLTPELFLKIRSQFSNSWLDLSIWIFL